MLMSGVGVTAPLYASHVFTTISGQNKGFVSCVHFIILAILIGNSLKSQNRNEVEKSIEDIPTKSSEGITSKNTEINIKSDDNTKTDKKVTVTKKK